MKTQLIVKNSTGSDDPMEKMVGVAGFEPAASWTRTMRDTKLRHTPMQALLYHGAAKSQEQIRPG